MPGENFVLDFKFGGNAEFLARLESLMRRVDKMFDATAEDIKDTTQATNELNKAARNAEPSLNKMTGGLTRLAGALKSVAASYVGLQGIMKLWSFGNDSIDLYNTQLRQERQLQTVLKNKGMGEAEFNAVKQHAANIQGRTIYGDEAMIAGAGELATYVKSTSSMTQMMDLLADYAAGMTGGGEVTPQQMVDLATGLGKAFDGSYEAFRKKGFDTSGLEKIARATELQEKIARGEGPNKLSAEDREALSFLNSHKGESIEDLKIEAIREALADWAGLSETFAQTDEGKIIQIKNAIGDMKEDLGKRLLPVVANIMSKVQDNLPKIQRMMDALGNAFIAIGDTLSANMDKFMAIGEFFAKVLTFVADFPVLSATAVLSLIAIKDAFNSAGDGALKLAKDSAEAKAEIDKLGMSIDEASVNMGKMASKTGLLIGVGGAVAGGMSYNANASESDNAASGLKGFALATAAGASQMGLLGAAIAATTFTLGGLISGIYQLWEATGDSDDMKDYKERAKDMEDLLRIRKQWKNGDAAGAVNYQRALSEYEAKWGSLGDNYLTEGFGGRATMGKALDDAMEAAKNGTPNIKVNSDNVVSQTVNMETSIAEAYAVMRTTMREFIDDTIKTDEIFNGAEMAQ